LIAGLLALLALIPVAFIGRSRQERSQPPA